MTLHTGRAEDFRTASWAERMAPRFRRGGKPAPALLRRIYEGVLERWPGNHLVSALPGGERIRVSARHRYLSWNPEEYAAFRAAARPGDLVIDVGANVGAYTLLFAHWVGPTGRVVAFEPAPDAAAGLRRHLALNALASRVEVHEMAVSDRSGTAFFDAVAASGSNALVSAATASSLDVRTTTLDEFCSAGDLRPRVVKIDVEGAELSVLRGARRLLADPAVDIFVELHPSAWRTAGMTADAVAAALHALGVAPVALDPALDVWSTEGIAARLERR
jgi:FkbM family methyltransferase